MLTFVDMASCIVFRHGWCQLTSIDLTRRKLINWLFEENLDGPLYYKIISQILLAFMVEIYDFDCHLYQDYDRKHTALLNQNLLEDLGIVWVKIPSFWNLNIKSIIIKVKKKIKSLPKSQDLNLIWADLKKHWGIKLYKKKLTCLMQNMITSNL